MANYRQIFRSTGLLGSVQLLYILIAILRNKVAAIFIGAAGMGLADLYARTIELLGSATNFGLGMSAVKQLAELCGEEEQQKEKSSARSLRPFSSVVYKQVCVIRTWVLFTAILGTLTCLALAPLLSRWATDSPNHTEAFYLLAPMVGLTTLTSGEMAILKATRRLRRLASATSAGAVATLFLTSSLYAWLGVKGIVPALVLSAAGLFVFHLQAATRDFPYHINPFCSSIVRKGLPLVRLGTAFILAGIMTSGAEMIIRSALMHNQAGTALIGLYAAGLALTVSYARMIFVAMDAEYFPRLTTILGNRRETNLTINRQINSLIVLMAPFLLIFCLFLPLIVRLLYTEEFLDIIPMVICAAPFMYFKAIYTPIAYLPLAHGDSVRYMTMEFIYNVVFCIAVIVGFTYGGLWGAGIGLTLANLFDLLLISLSYSLHYGYRMNADTLRRSVLLLFPLLTGLYCAWHPSFPLRIAGGSCCLLLMVALSWSVFKRIKRR